MRNRPEDLGKTISTLLAYMGRHAKSFLIVGVLVSFSALSNLLGTYMIKPVVNDAASQNWPHTQKMILVMALIYLVGVLSAWGYTQMMARSAQDVVYDIRQDLFQKMQDLPIRVFDSNSHGDLMSRFTNDVDTVSDALNNSFAMCIQAFIQVVGTMVLLVILNWKLSLIVAVFYIVMFFYIRFAGRVSKKYFSRQQRSLGAINGFIEEMITGLKVVKVFNHETQNAEVFAKYNEELQNSGQKALSFSQTMVPMVVSLSYVNYLIVTLVGGYMCLKHQSTVGALASYLVFVRQAAMPLNQFTQQSNLLLSALSGAERIFEFMEIPPEIDKGTVTLAYGKKENGQWTESQENTGIWLWKHPRKNGLVEYVKLEGNVRLENVDFGYTEKKKILKDITLYANAGQKIALVGSTGAGKTTITNLLNRFYEINRGMITFDGIDIRLIKKDDLRKALGMVLQDTHLFTGTIMDNIRYGKLNAGDEECIEAAKLANAHSFITRLPHGYQTVITNDGSSLSQGQRQLLAIARAAIADPAVLILDEATSSIDTRTERLIEKGMDRLMEGRTTFIIAHRLSTVRNSDLIVVLEKGQILEKGSHDALLEKKGRYYQLYQGMFELS